MTRHWHTAFILAWAASGAVVAQERSPPAPVDTLPGAARTESTPAAPRAQRDALDWRMRHSPKKASILSAVVPGAGQIYNRKYWKAPIAWGGIGLSVWFINDNGHEYRRYKDAYIAVVDGDPATVDEFEGRYSAEQLLSVTDTYRRWRDLSVIALGVVHLLNIVDASVDAHFVRFDVGADLSLGAGPSLLLASQGTAGLSLSLVVR